MFDQHTDKSYSKDNKQSLKTYINIFCDILFRNFWPLIKLNLLFILCCIPIVTIGPSLAGLNYVLRNYCLEKNVWLWEDFKHGFVSNFKNSFLVSIINLFILSMIYIDYRFYMTIKLNIVTSLLAYVVFGIGIIFLILCIYIFPTIVTYDLSIKDIYKNSFIFTVIKFPQTFLIFILCVILLALCVLLYYIPLILIGFSITGLIINIYCRTVFNEYIEKKN